MRGTGDDVGCGCNPQWGLVLLATLFVPDLTIDVVPPQAEPPGD